MLTVSVYVHGATIKHMKTAKGSADTHFGQF